MASDPLKLMSRVVVGNWRAESLKVVLSRNRATVPSAPPSAMATSTAGERLSRGTATLSSASPLSVMVLLSLARAAACAAVLCGQEPSADSAVRSVRAPRRDPSPDC
jgi:hypothetical protein